MVATGRRQLSRPADVLVVGAGPTGLAAALQAHDHGATVRVVERRAAPFRPSRAMITHPRTLENLRPLGVTEALLERGDTAPRAQLQLGRKRVCVQLADLALPDTAFPHLTLLRQMDVEEVLANALSERGVDVERGVELVEVADRQDGDAPVRATLRSQRGVDEAACRFVAGCDGSASTVRDAAGIGWRGGPYWEEVVLADVELDGDLTPGLLHVVAARDGLLFVFALGEGATWRLLATRRRPDGDPPTPVFGQTGSPVSVRELQRFLDLSGLDAAITDLRWSGRVRLQHRLADAYRHGRLFLAGDAAHTHSPAAAQGMNTGIQDAINLGWKLAYAAKGGDHAALLDSYEQERRPVARRVLAMTRLVFFAEASTHPLPAFLRSRLAPLAAPAVPALVNQRRLVAEAVRTLSQLRVRYRHSVISRDEAPPSTPGARPGDRLSDTTVTCEGAAVRLHDLTASPGVHVLLSRDADAIDAQKLGTRASVHRLTSQSGRGVLAVRPDGHIGYRSTQARPAALGAWLDLVGARGAQ